MFVDLNVVQCDKDTVKNQTLMQRLQQLGYDSFAFNKYIRGRVKRETAPKIAKIDSPQGPVDHSVCELFYFLVHFLSSCFLVASAAMFNNKR
jgi:hypothetical protein